ncbi:hypothetical protein [Auraticoccus monumenti]|uniref:PAS fold-containing protein n=1 Tax=Auraticoccus monumenti TaxID=675864 RepID=A0A1G6SWL8_9ACTN|nr:hypothetical protein [Auraticoccus monumenti]SDD21370.1 hypothetical protein SAMN04489747_0455 [Auraticoccus monumenti]
MSLDLRREPGTVASGLLRTGSFTAVLDEDVWAWSSELVAMLGFTEHPVEATTEIFLEHVWASDRASVCQALEEATGGPTATMATLLTEAGRPLSVVLSAQPAPGHEHIPDWLTGAVQGTVVDLGDRFRG